MHAVISMKKNHVQSIIVNLFLFTGTMKISSCVSNTSTLFFMRNFAQRLSQKFSEKYIILALKVAFS